MRKTGLLSKGQSLSTQAKAAKKKYGITTAAPPAITSPPEILDKAEQQSKINGKRNVHFVEMPDFRSLLDVSQHGINSNQAEVGNKNFTGNAKKPAGDSSESAENFNVIDFKSALNLSHSSGKNIDQFCNWWTC